MPMTAAPADCSCSTPPSPPPQPASPPPPAAAAQGPHHRGRRRQGLGRHGAGGRGALAGPARGSRRHALRPWRALRAHRDRRGGASGARCGRHAARPSASSTSVQGLGAGRSRALPHFGRRLGAAGPARSRADARGQAGGQHARCCARGANIGEMNCVRKHLRPSRAAGWPPRRIRRSVRDAADLRRAGRRPATSPPARPCPTRPPLPTRCAILAPLRHRAAAAPCARTSNAAEDETPKPGDPRLAARRDAHDRRRRRCAGSRGRGRARRPASRRSSSATRSRARRARSAGHGRHRAPGRRGTASRSPRPCVLLSGGETTVTVRGTRPRRAQRRVPAGAGRGARRPARRPRDRRRHRRDRRRRGHCRRVRHARHARPRRGARHRRADEPRRQRRSRLLRGARRLRSSPARRSPTSTTSAPS